MLPQHEEALRCCALDDVPELLLADQVSHAVADLVQATPVDARLGNRTPEEYQHNALWLMAVIGVRALRAAMNVIAVGYEDQAAGYVRLIDELWNRAQKVRSDHSGTYAKRWCEGKPPGKGGAGKNPVTSRHFGRGGLTGRCAAVQALVAARCTAGRFPLLAASRCP